VTAAATVNVTVAGTPGAQVALEVTSGVADLSATTVVVGVDGTATVRVTVGTLRRTCTVAVARGVGVGAQVSYRDLAGFGRRFVDVPADELCDEVLYQLGALAGLARVAGARLQHVKPHGALYNRACRDARTAGPVAAVAALTGLAVMGLPGSELQKAAERVRVIPLGVDAERFRPEADPAALRARLGLAGPRRWALTVARLVPHKGIDTTLEVVAGLAREGVDLGYLVVGEGPMRAALEAQAAALGIADRVRWLGGVPDDRLPGVYAAADLYLGLSREEGPQAEGFGLALLEAQAAGLPVVAGRGGGTADAVADGVTGVLVPPTELPVILAAARALLGDDARARAMGAAGRERVEREFGWSRVLRDLDAAAAGFTAAKAAAGPAGR